MSDIQPTEAEREEAQRLLEHIYSLHGFISQKDRMTRQLSKLELDARRKEREDALIRIILAYRADAVKAERENAICREQEARADERRRCAEAAVEFVDANYNEFGEWDDVAFNDLRATILQGTEPANEWDRLTKKEMWDTIQEIREKVGSDGTQSILADIDEYVENAIDGAQPPEPAKVSEDVER